MAIEDNSCPHRCLKITLTVLYSIGVVLSFIFLVQAIKHMAFAIDDDHSKITDGLRKEILFLLIDGIVVLALSLLFYSITLFAVVKEKKHILPVFTAFQVIICGLFLRVGFLYITMYIYIGIGHVVMAIMLGVFTYIVTKRQKVR